MDLPLSKLIPHSGVMRLIEEPIDFSEEMGKTSLIIREDSFLYSPNKGVPSYLAIEYIAQTAAAVQGFSGLKNPGTPKLGFLLGVREYKTNTDYFTLGSFLEVTVTLLIKSGNVARFQGRVYCQGDEIASAILTTIEPDNEILENLKK